MMRRRPFPWLLVLRLLVCSLVLALPACVIIAPPAPAATAPDPVGEWPLRPVPDVLRDFHPPLDPWGAGHRGVDLAGAPGQAVHAALGGRVAYAAPLAGRGVVVVTHGATRTTYEPVSAAVRVGQPVTAGERLGGLELTGSHCFPRACLHWGWLRGHVYLDPLRLVVIRVIRLLPLWSR
jgi:murein DD-endopeptidase MepM/ murein hydrolase activator NlpD